MRARAAKTFCRTSDIDGRKLEPSGFRFDPLRAPGTPTALRATRSAEGAGRKPRRSTSKEATIRDKAERGIKAYLERQGFEIIEEGWAHGSDRIYLRTWEVAVSQVPK